MKKSFILILSLSLMTLFGEAQEKRYDIFGVVKDSSGNPVENLTIFIPFTSIGTTTNEKGEYRLGKVPAGEKEIVFRHISFLPLTKILTNYPGKSIELNVTMEANVVELNEIIKKANPANWKFGFEKFKEYVLGDPFGRMCEVQNPTDLFFYYDGRRLKGHATKPLEIVNKYLGYKLIYFLDYFWFNEDKSGTNGSTKQTSFAFSGSAFYIEELKGNAYKETTWEKNRDLEFKGTLKHFIISLYDDQLAEQGFELRQVWTDVRDMQKYKNLSPALAYARSLEMEKRFYWDKSLQKSGYLFFSPGEDYPVQAKITDLNQVPPSKSLVMNDRLIVFYYWNSKHLSDEARVAYLAVEEDESGDEPVLLIENDGNYTVNGGELIWDYLDTQTKLITALPADYEGMIK